MTKPAQKPDLAENLKQAVAIKAEMTGLLQELESTAAGHTIQKPGGWRHHPVEWAAQHLT